MSTSTSPKSTLAKLALSSKSRPFKVMVLGQTAIGKTALVVRFITRRFIYSYDPTLEQIYPFQTIIDNETVNFEILDSVGEPCDGGAARLEANIRWADAFVLMYSVTDKCSFDECHRLKFLINYIKRRSRFTSPILFRDGNVPEVPVVLVGNKNEIPRDRMVSTADGKRRSMELGCVCFHEISVMESIEQCQEVFRDLRRLWRVNTKWSGGRGWWGEPSATLVGAGAVARLLQRASSDDTASTSVSTGSEAVTATEDLEEEDEWLPEGVSHSASASLACEMGQLDSFRARASTDSRLPQRPTRPRDPRPNSPLPPLARRMSVAMRGNNANSY